MAKKSKSESPRADSIITWTCAIGAFISLVVIIPAVPWRTSAIDMQMGARFSVTRSLSLYAVTDNIQKSVPWLKFRKDVCRKVADFNRPNPMRMLVGVVAGEVGTGSAVTGCAGWQNCKDHAAARCTAYGTMAMTGLGCIALQLIGTIAGVMSIVFIRQEASIKKEKDLKAAQFNTLTATVGAGVSTCISVLTWFYVSDSSFKSLKKTGYYPYPAAGPGLYIATVGAVLLFAAMVCGINRFYKIIGYKKAEDGDEGANGDPNAGGMDPGMGGMGGMGGGFGGPPGYGGAPGYGGPPGMGMPPTMGMGMPPPPPMN